jgi:hypothetical protein
VTVELTLLEMAVSLGSGGQSSDQSHGEVVDEVHFGETRMTVDACVFERVWYCEINSRVETSVIERSLKKGMRNAQQSRKRREEMEKVGERER